MDSSSNQSTAVQELNQLFQEGARKGLWENNKAACAGVIGMERRDLSRLLHGHRSDVEVSPVLQKMRDAVQKGALSEVLDQTSEEEVNEAQTEFDRYYELGLERGLWGGPGACAEALDIDRNTVRKYRITPAETLSGTSLKGKTLYEKNMEKMRTYVQRRRGPQAARRPDANPTIARIDVLEAKLPGLIQAALAQSERESQPAPEGVVPSDWANDVIGGLLEITDQRRGDVRFVVTADTFRKLLAHPLSREEVGDTKALADISTKADTELRRRLEALHQTEESPQRAEAIRALVPSLSERIREAVALAITVEMIREYDVDKGLIRAARHFESLSDIFSK